MVEVYIESELQDLVTDAEKTEEWRKKAEELGLDGQLKLIEGKKSPIPFPCMNKGMVNVYETLCPVKAKFNEYSRTTMPTRVLEMIGLCVKENYFEKLEVWSDDVKPDPILVGLHDDGQYLVARWGDELRAYAELRQMARDRKYTTEKNRLDESLANLDRNVEKFIRGEWVYF